MIQFNKARIIRNEGGRKEGKSRGNSFSKSKVSGAQPKNLGIWNLSVLCHKCVWLDSDVSREYDLSKWVLQVLIIYGST